jgi:hypothetical protein
VPPNGLEWRNTVAGTNATHNIGFFVLASRRDDQLNRLPNHVGRGVSVHAFGGGVPRRDDAVEVLTDDRVVGILDNVRQPPGEFVSRLPIGDIARETSRVQKLVIAP